MRRNNCLLDSTTVEYIACKYDVYCSTTKTRSILASTDGVRSESAGFEERIVFFSLLVFPNPDFLIRKCTHVTT